MQFQLPIKVDLYGQHYWLIDATGRKLARVEGVGLDAKQLAGELALTYNYIARAKKGGHLGPRTPRHGA